MTAQTAKTLIALNKAMLKKSYNLNIVATNNNLVIDPSRLLEPQCVLCFKADNIYKKLKDKKQSQSGNFEQLDNKKNPKYLIDPHKQ
jgi:hypothetical protein